MMDDPAEADLAVAMAYVAGDMAEAERVVFERRLRNEPSLAAVVESCLDTDELLWRNRRLVVARPARSVAWSWRLVAFASAAVVMVALGIRLFLTSPAPAEASGVGLLAGFQTLGEYSLAHAPLKELRPPSSDAPRGASEESVNISAREYLDRAGAIEEEEITRSLSTSARELIAERFHVVIETRQPTSLLVLGIPDVGPAERLFPSPASGPLEQQAASARVASGRIVLPEARVTLIPGSSPGHDVVSTSWGFTLTPRARSMEVFVAMRPQHLSTADLARLDAELALGLNETPSLSEQIRSDLSDMGFHVTVGRVTANS